MVKKLKEVKFWYFHYRSCWLLVFRWILIWSMCVILWWVTLGLAFMFPSNILLFLFQFRTPIPIPISPRELLPVYQDVILPLADVAIPNQFEAELITGTIPVDITMSVLLQVRPSQMRRRPLQWWRCCTRRVSPQSSCQGSTSQCYETASISIELQHWAWKQWPPGGIGKL